MILQNALDDLGTAFSGALQGLMGFIITIGLVATVFCIVVGAILFFTGYSHNTGKALLVNGIMLTVVLTVLYTWLFGVDTVPDVTAFFRSP